jgi:hypothetical protein
MWEKPDKIYLEKGFGTRSSPANVGYFLHYAPRRELLQQSDISAASCALISCHYTPLNLFELNMAPTAAYDRTKLT